MFRTLRSPVPMVHQAEAGECGLACLAMVAQHHGAAVDLTEIRERFSLSRSGARLRDLMQIASTLDLRCRPLKLELDELSELRLPAILHWDLDHFVVASKLTRRGLIVNDPSRGIRCYGFAELALHFTGVALETAELVRLPGKQAHGHADQDQPIRARRRLGLGSMLPMLGNWHRHALQIGALSLLIQLLAILSPLYLQLVIDQGISAGDREFILLLGLLFLLISIGRTALSYFRDRQLLSLSCHFSSNLARSCFDHLIRLPLNYFRQRELGDIVSRFHASGSISQFISYQLVAILVDGLFSVLTVVLLFLYSPLLASVVLLSVLAVILIRVFSLPTEQQLREQQIVSAAKQESSLLETIKGIHSVKANGIESHRSVRWFSRFAESMNSSFSLSGFQLKIGSVQGLLQAGEQLLVVYLGALLILDRSLSIGQFMSFFFLRQHFTGSMLAMLPKLAELRLLRIELDRLDDIVGQPLPPEPAHGALLASTLHGPLGVDSLGFRYGQQPAIFSELSFSVAPGQSLAIVGRSGCGKSTLLRLVAGLEPLQQGSIKFGNRTLAEATSGQLRSSLASVLHEDQLFSGTLAFNIHLGRGDASAERLREQIEMVELQELLDTLPLGLLTPVGDLGSVLSAGQVQRILIARAMFANPAYLLLDEALSHVDDASALRILKRLKERDLTLIMVSHNSKLIEETDCILSLG